MFKYFPTNYVWNLSVDLSIEMGARMGEIEEMCAPLQEAARRRTPPGHKRSARPGSKWRTSWFPLPRKTKPRGG